MVALYNEIDPFAAATIRGLIERGLVAPGVVDERSIEDLTPEYVSQFTQVHFFAGISVWSHALRQAGVSDDTPLWTGSCPCQPFSSAGKGDGFDDERHLWPAWFWLIEQCRPERLFGEQVASKDANTWVALVQADLEAVGYTFGAVPFTAAGVGAPNIRERLYWMADSNAQQYTNGKPRSSLVDDAPGRDEGAATVAGLRSGERMGDSNDTGLEVGQFGPHGQLDPQGRESAERSFGLPGVSGGVGNTTGERQQRSLGSGYEEPEVVGRLFSGRAGADIGGVAGPERSFWSDSEWVLCRDPSGPRWRPVEPGTFPLAHGLARGMGSLDARLSELASVADLDAASLRDAKSYRVGSLKAYGNAINAVAATEFIKAAMNE